jgi:two-component system chemotaxis response regulator CheY
MSAMPDQADFGAAGNSAARKSCLIVEDSRVIRKISRHIVESLGLSVSEAEDGRQGLKACDEAMPDLVLLDWNMPVMNGIEFIHELRARPDGGYPKVVFCTTEYDANHIREAIAAGADEYVMKPFDHDTLQLKLQLVGIV